MTLIVAETIWIQKVLVELQISSSVAHIVYCDNVNASHLAKHPIVHARTKHVEMGFHFIRERIMVGELQVSNTPTQKPIADIMTKALS